MNQPDTEPSLWVVVILSGPAIPSDAVAMPVNELPIGMLETGHYSDYVSEHCLCEANDVEHPNDDDEVFTYVDYRIAPDPMDATRTPIYLSRGMAEAAAELLSQ